MYEFRHQRLSHRVHELLNHCLRSKEAKDPRLHALNVVRIKLAKDFATAVVFVCSEGGEAPSEEIMKVLKHSAGFFQSYIAAHMRIRKTPRLSFVADDSLKSSAKIWNFLDNL